MKTPTIMISLVLIGAVTLSCGGDGGEDEPAVSGAAGATTGGAGGASGGSAGAAGATAGAAGATGGSGGAAAGQGGGAGVGGAGAGGAGAGGAGGDAGAAGEAGNAGAGGSPNTCANTTCDPNATCNDGSGTPVCSCNGGYSGDGTTCTDDDECGVGGTNNCDVNATCTNTPGSFTCACAGDYIGDGLTCALAVSCVDLITNVPTATTGLHMIDPDASGPGAAIQAYCDMTPGDAGWTLVMKAINDNFVYTDALWSDDTVINGADFDFTLDKTKAKYDTFGTVAFTSIRSSYVDDFSKHYDYTPATTYGSAKALFAGPGIQISATNPAPLDPYWDGIVGAEAKSAFCVTHVVVGINMQDFLGLAFLNDSSVCDWNGGARFGQRVNAYHGGTGNHSGQGWGAYSTIFPGYPAPFEITQLLWVRLDLAFGPVPAQRCGAAPRARRRCLWRHGHSRSNPLGPPTAGRIDTRALDGGCCERCRRPIRPEASRAARSCGAAPWGSSWSASPREGSRSAARGCGRPRRSVSRSSRRRSTRSCPPWAIGSAQRPGPASRATPGSTSPPSRTRCSSTPRTT